MAKKPNLLVIMSDQHHPHVLGCEGDAVVRTPHLDRLAARGAMFTDCYCPAPLCVPSRMSFMTGRYPSRNEVWSNTCSLSSSIPTFAHALTAAGYETVISGRMHFVGVDQRHGFEQRIMGALCSGYLGGSNNTMPRKLLQATGQDRRAVEVAGPGRTGYQFYDEAVTEATVSFLEERGAESADRPFCLMVGYVLPHCPFVCPKEDFGYYLDRVTLPEVPEGYFEQLHPAMQERRRSQRIEDLSEDEIRRARAGYYGLVTHFDRQVGRVLDALEGAGLGDETVVVYTSDHGEMAGENGQWWKSNFYEGAASVPLIVSTPWESSPGKRVERVVNLVDIGPTLIDLAGGEPLPDVDGRSFAGFLEAGDAAWTDESFSEHMPCHGVPAARMIRQGPWKLVHYEGHRPQLFNLEDDPSEFNNLGDDPAHEAVRERLHARVLEGWSAAYMTEKLEERNRTNAVLIDWYRQREPLGPEQWTVSPDATVFPDEG